MSVVENSKRTENSVLGRTSSRSSSSSTTTVQILPFPDMTDTWTRKRMEDLKELHLEIFERPMPRPIAQRVLRDLDGGIPPEYYEYAMCETVFAPTPSWRYTMAIVARCVREKVEIETLDY